jgi:hypothetical protein
MKTETRIDGMLQRLYDMNNLADLRQAEHDSDSSEPAENKKKKGGKGGKGGKSGGFLSTVVNEILFRRSGENRFVSPGEPSDGHPQEELTPDFQLFRGLNHNNATWTLYWPDLII